MVDAAIKPKGYGRLPLALRKRIADAAAVVAVLGMVWGLIGPVSVTGLWLRIPALIVSALMAAGCWAAHRKFTLSPVLRNGIYAAALGAALLTMTFHRASQATSLAGLLALVAALAAHGGIDVERPFSMGKRKDWVQSLRDNIEGLGAALVIVLIIWHFALEAFRIPTGSMLPTLYGDPVWGDRVLVDKFCYEFGDPRRWEPVVFRYPLRRTDPYVKRCIALPGEQLLIAQGDIYVRKTESAEVELLTKPSDARAVLWYPIVGPIKSRTDFLKHFSREGAGDFSDGKLVFGREGEEGAVIFPKDESGRPGNVRDHDPSGQGNAADYNRHIVGDLRVRVRMSPGPGRATIVLVRDDEEFALSAVIEKDQWSWSLNRRERTGDKTLGDWKAIDASGLAAAEFRQGGVAEIVFGLADGTLRVERASASVEVKVGSRLLDALRARDTELARQGKASTSLDSAEAMKLASQEPGFGRRAQVRFEVTGKPPIIEILGIDRDVYYVGRVLDTGQGQKELPFALTLGDDEYFVLGDNSPGSKDTRYWIEASFIYEDGTGVAGGLDDQGQYIGQLLYDTPGIEDFGDKAGSSPALLSLQRVARFTQAERGADAPTYREVVDSSLRSIQQHAAKLGVERLPFINSEGQQVSLEIGRIKQMQVKLVPFVKRRLFVGRPFAVFLWPQRMKLID